jgi:hypothetical protein
VREGAGAHRNQRDDIPDFRKIEDAGGGYRNGERDDNDKEAD